MTIKTSISLTGEQVVNALSLLIEERSKGPFIDLDDGEAQTEAMLERRRKERAALQGPESPGHRTRS